MVAIGIGTWMNTPCCKTDMIVGLQHGVFIHVPIPMATMQRKRLSNEEWAAVVMATGQGDLG